MKKIRGCMDLKAAPDIFNMFESTDRERSSWAGLKDIAIYLPSLSPPILSLREKKNLGETTYYIICVITVVFVEEKN